MLEVGETECDTKSVDQPNEKKNIARNSIQFFDKSIFPILDKISSEYLMRTHSFILCSVALYGRKKNGHKALHYKLFIAFVLARSSEIVIETLNS